MDEMQQYECEIEICGRPYCLVPAIKTTLRVERAIGPVDPFAKRVIDGNVTTDELVRAYDAVLRDDPKRPERAELEAWAVRTGVFGHRALGWYLYTLIIGADTLAREFERINATIRAAEAAKGGRGPFAQPLPG